MKAIFQILNGRSAGFETGQLRTRTHDFDDAENVFHVLSGCHQSLKNEDFVIFEHVGSKASHDGDKLRCEFER